MIDSDNKRVAKNTIILYMRMVVTVILGIFTSRIILNALGFTDQGLYNLVGGFVGFLSLITNSLSNSISRFITYEIGRGYKEKINEVYQNTCSVQIILSLIVILFAETLGLWLLSNKLVIPPDRMFAVHIVYQMSVATFIFNLLSVSQSAIIIAHERMNIYAYISIFNAVGSFCVALMISHTGLDRLILYSILQFVLSFLVRLFYTLYVRYSFSFCRFKFKITKSYFSPIFRFAGWNFIGSSAQIIRVSGTGILLNLFGGPIANTINGIANSVNNLATVFVTDFTTAYNPQITKKYAQEKYADMVQFVSNCSKYSFFLLSIIAIPVLINVHPLLILWLEKVPEGTTIFAQLIIVYSLIECFSKPIITAKNATGKIRNFQVVVGFITLFTIPLSYIFLKIGLPIWTTYVSMIITAFISLITRMKMMQGDIPTWSTWNFCKDVLFRCCFTAAVCIFPLYFLFQYTSPSRWWTILSCATGMVWCLIVCYVFGCDNNEKRNMVLAVSMVRKKFLK